MAIRIALAGNPNSGKTTLFNALTGSRQYVGNWPGVTVERKEGKLKAAQGAQGDDVIVQDLPGVYSLSPYTLEEVITRNYLVDDRPDAIINIVDGTNLERNLYLSTQLAELGIPMLIAVNMMDVVRKQGDRIDLNQLSAQMGVEAMPLSALTGEGAHAVAQAAVRLARQGTVPRPLQVFDGPVAHALAHIEDALTHRRHGHHHHGGDVRRQGEAMPAALRRWYAIKLFERDDKVLAQLRLAPDVRRGIEQAIADCEQEMDDDAQSIITNQRYACIQAMMHDALRRKRAPGSLSASDKIDRVVTNRVLGFPIFIAVMFLVYYIAVTTVGAVVTDFTNDTFFGAWIIPGLESWLSNVGVSDWLSGLITEGIVGGVGAVLGFVPQMFVLFFMLAILEDVGYMARVAFIMDRIFRRFGLSGKSFIPMLIGSGCSVPGIMASRTIENQRDRRMTIITTSFIPCGAKLPIIAMIAGTVLGGAWWVGPMCYFIGIAAVVVSGIILKKTRHFAGDPAPFVMELPAYHLPGMGNVLRSMWERGFSFIKRAGTVILLSSIAIWFLKSYGWADGKFAAVEDMDHSILAAIGGAVAPVFKPLGFGNWQNTVATVLGLVAKEEVVSVFGVLYGVGENALDLVEEGAFDQLAPIAMNFTSMAAISFLTFNLLCAPCFAAIGAIKREMSNWRWTAFAVGYQTVFAYVISFIVYQLGMIVTTGFQPVHLLPIALLAGLVYLVFSPTPYGHNDAAPQAVRA
ncbi:MAG: ferrous iron transport protein B [Clostridiales bacterium]|nr:ferrous iron transport protein B [Clostridiales bacterium]